MTTTVEPTPEQVAYRSLLASIKQDIKNSMVSLRAEKREISATQKAYGPGSAAGFQSQLARHRNEARARHLIYGALRGRTWDQMEPKRTQPAGYLAYWIKKVWTDLGTSVPMPSELQETK